MKKTRLLTKGLITAFALLSIAVAFTAVASEAHGSKRAGDNADHPKGPHFAEMMKRFDTNGDGELQPEEMTKMRAEHEAKREDAFKKADTNSDGKLCFAEFQSLEKEHMPKPAHSVFEEMDTNKDGLIQLFELPQPGNESKASPRHSMNHRSHERGERPDMPPPPPGEDFKAGPSDRPDMPPPPHPSADQQEKHEHHRPDMSKWFDECDSDGNRAIDQNELKTHHDEMQLRHFARMDTNHDGYLQAEEFQAHRGPGGHPQLSKTANGSMLDEDSETTDVTLATSDNVNSSEYVNGFKLNDNYPNPFNSTTLISYQIPEAGHVTLTIYNLNGEVVGTLVDETQAAGQYQVSTNMAEQTSGIYFYRLQAGSYTDVNKMTYVK